MLTLRLVAFQVACAVREYQHVDFGVPLLAFDSLLAGVERFDLDGDSAESDPI